MISFHSEVPFEIVDADAKATWLTAVISSENYKEGEVSIVFCDDHFLHKLNVEFLDHDTLTDVISFDYSIGKEIHGEIFISIERVKENSLIYDTVFEDELHRVIIHGVLHYCGYNDKTKKEADIMRTKEDAALSVRKFL